MAQASYSFLDVAALDEVRERFAAGDALVMLSADLSEVIWANGPGAALFGQREVEAIFGAEAPLGAAARRQIAALRGFPAIGRDRPLLVRITLGISSEAQRFLASAVTLPDGEAAILLAQPVAEGMQEKALASAIGGFSESGHFIAFVGAEGQVEAASPAFERLGLTTEALAEVARGATDGNRIAKRLLNGRRGPLPAGLARLTTTRNLIVVIDENWAEEPLASIEPPKREVWYLGSDHVSEAPPMAAAASGGTVESLAEEVKAEPIVGVSAGQAAPTEADTPTHVVAETHAVAEKPDSEEEAEVEQALDHSGGAVEQADAVAPKAEEGLPSEPVRFSWKTDAEGSFTQVSDDFTRAVGKEAADIVGRRFIDVSNAFGLDHGDDVAALLERRDTWSGRTVLWPVAGTDLHVPVDLAALPVYDRSRDFQGFRGFGVARMGDASVDPEGVGLALRSVPKPVKEAAPEKAPAPSPAVEEPVPDKVINLAERRPAAHAPTPAPAPVPTQGTSQGPSQGLSQAERLAFQAIGERLKQASGQVDAARKADASQSKAEQADAPAGPSGAAERVGAVKETQASAADGTIAELRALDGVEDTVAENGVGPTADAAADRSQERASAPVDPVVQDAAPRPAKSARPGLSLLDFGQMKDEAARETAARVEMEEAAATELRQEAVADEVDPDLAKAGTVLPEAETPSDEAVTTSADASQTVESLLDETDAEEPVGAVSEDEPDEEDATQSRVETSEATDSGLAILEKLPLSVLVHSGDVLHYANNEFFSLTGYGSLEDFAEAGGIGALFADSYEDASQEGKHDRHLMLQTREGAAIPIEAFLQSIPWEDGKALILVLSPVKDGFGGQSPLIAELEARVAEMRTIIDTATDGVVLIAPDGAIRSISRPAEALFGLESDEVAGKHFTTLFAMESQKAARDYLAGLSNHGVASVLNDGREVIGREAEGRFIPLFMTIGMLPGDSGYCAVVRDITQWKRAEEDLTQARATAERASSHKSDFLARVSHEIRTPLNAIIGFSELMLDEKFGPVANDRYRDYLRDINRSGNHVLDLVNDLLDISKIEAGQQEMSYEAVPLNDTLSETVALMQPQANRERVIIRSSFASKLPDVVADLRSVRQIALNILSNAVRYTQAGGQVIVSTAYEAHGEVVMRVRDTGIGMTPAEIEQALKPFKQINSLKRPRGDGTGLGLPLTKAMVEANRAKFSIQSTPGEGTLVEVAFPSTRVLAD